MTYLASLSNLAFFFSSLNVFVSLFQPGRLQIGWALNHGCLFRTDHLHAVKKSDREGVLEGPHPSALLRAFTPPVFTLMQDCCFQRLLERSDMLIFHKVTPIWLDILWTFASLCLISRLHKVITGNIFQFYCWVYFFKENDFFWRPLLCHHNWHLLKFKNYYVFFTVGVNSCFIVAVNSYWYLPV